MNTTHKQQDDADWNASMLIDERTGVLHLGIWFPTNNGAQRLGLFDRDLIENPRKLRKQLNARGAALSGGETIEINFVKQLTASVSGASKTIARKPGWRGDGFVLGKLMLGPAAEAYVADPDHDYGGIGDRLGSLQGWQCGVGRVVAKSYAASFAVMVGLAAPLQTYVKQRLEKNPDVTPLLPESAVYNFYGKSGVGKTSLELAVAGLIGKPEALCKWDFSQRGLEEEAERHNDLCMVLDDVETHTGTSTELKKSLQTVNQVLSSGQSRTISRAVYGALPPLSWWTFGISSSPAPIESYLLNLGMSRTDGARARLFDIAAGVRSKGGIFDTGFLFPEARMKRAKKLIRTLEAGIENNYGVVMPAWIDWLSAADRSQEIQRLIGRFVAEVAGGGTGYDERYARKFGVAYAAGKLAVQAGILPWSSDWPLEAAGRCYGRARKHFPSSLKTADNIIVELARKVRERNGISGPAVGDRPISVGPGALGILVRRKEKLFCGVFHDAFRKLAGGAAVAREVQQRLVARQVLGPGQGHARTVQLILSVRRAGKIVKKPRVLLLDVRRLQLLADKIEARSARDRTG